MPADLLEKADRYERLLAEALDSVEPVATGDTPLGSATAEFEEMARAYYEDGRHFRENGDPVNALASFAYGHAWLDAGARLGLFDVHDDVSDLFTV